MASSRNTLNGPDWEDVARAMLAFEDAEHCRVVLTINSGGDASAPDLVLQAQALGDAGSALEVITLASVSAKCSGTRLKSLEAALFQLMYALDFQSAANAYLASKDREA